MSAWPSSARWTRTDTPLGAVVVVADHAGLVSIRFDDVLRTGLDQAGADQAGVDEAGVDELVPAATRDDLALRWLATMVGDWFGGDDELETLPVHLEGTAFQRGVLAELRHIPRGGRRSYAQIAAEVGRPDAARAVGQACARNPVALAVPCHRVVRADGGLGGYAWGVERKAALLELETAER